MWKKTQVLKFVNEKNIIQTVTIGLVDRVFANGPVDQGSISGWVIPKTQKNMVLDTALLNTQYYKVLSRVKWNNPGRGVAPCNN